MAKMNNNNITTKVEESKQKKNEKNESTLSKVGSFIETSIMAKYREFVSQIKSPKTKQTDFNDKGNDTKQSNDKKCLINLTPDPINNDVSRAISDNGSSFLGGMYFFTERISVKVMQKGVFFCSGLSKLCRTEINSNRVLKTTF